MVLFAVLAGCEGVQEDRTIEFSAGGESVGFQHGEQGVFVAEKGGTGLKKVFQPGDDVLATSTPLWAPKGRRLIFTKGRDSHDYKFSSAALEDFYHTTPAWRERYLATAMFNLRGANDQDNTLIQRTRAALGA